MNESDELLDWAEDAGLENMREHVRNADSISHSANTILAIVLSGAGASLYFGGDHPELGWPALMISLWLFLIAIYLSLNCISFSDFPALRNEPLNLYQPRFSLLELRKAELKKLQERIDLANEINRKRSRHVNASIRCACATPLIALIGWLFSLWA